MITIMPVRDHDDDDAGMWDDEHDDAMRLFCDAESGSALPPFRCPFDFLSISFRFLLLCDVRRQQLPRVSIPHLIRLLDHFGDNSTAAAFSRPCATHGSGPGPTAAASVAAG